MITGMKKPAAHARPAKPKIKPRDVQGVKFLTQIMDLLAPLHAHRPDPKRKLHYDEYCAYLLLYFFTPILDSMRGLQQICDFDQIKNKLGLPRFSLGSFSEAGAVFDPELLTPLIAQIGARLEDIALDPRLGSLERRPTAVDGTLLHALPQMLWALWLDEDHRAAKLHLQLDLLRGAPLAATLTDAGASESQQLKQNLQPGRLYLNDRGYFDYLLLAAILEARSSFVARVRDNVGHEPLGAPRPLSAEAVRAGVVLDQLVEVGSKNHRQLRGRTLRLVCLRAAASAPRSGRRTGGGCRAGLVPAPPSDTTIWLLTDLLELDAELIALLYRYRWQIELFFRWFKKVLQADRLLALSQNGMTIVVYCALIASLLVVLWTGRKPTKRTFELLCFYFAGWVSDEELLVHLNRLEPADPKK